jgi:DNA modification methylase
MELNTIQLGDSRELVESLPDESIDLIFTDPPYTHESLYLYEWLAETSARVLKPGGFCLVYSGKYELDKVYLMMGKYLTYYWQFISFEPGNNGIMWARHMFTSYKPILAFSKGVSIQEEFISDVWTNLASDKRYHKWGQSERTAAYFLRHFSQPGDILYEPFTGGGTLPYVATQMQRNWYASEYDEQAYKIAVKRLQTIQLLLPNSEQGITQYEIF